MHLWLPEITATLNEDGLLSNCLMFDQNNLNQIELFSIFRTIFRTTYYTLAIFAG